MTASKNSPSHQLKDCGSQNDGAAVNTSDPRDSVMSDARSRQSSPAKRPRSQRDGTAEMAQGDEMEVDESSRSPTKKANVETHGSPLPSRFKTIDESATNHDEPLGQVRQDDQPRTTVAEVSSTSESHDGSSSTDATVVSSAPTLVDNDTEALTKTEQTEPPSFERQYETVLSLTTGCQITEGFKGFVVSCRWLNRVVARTSKRQHEGWQKSVKEGDVGPVDNRDLVPNLPQSSITGMEDGRGNVIVPMKPGLQISDDFEVLPQEAWNLVLQWYGLAVDSPIITRFAHNTSPDDAASENFQYEIYPPVFTVQKLGNESLERGLESIRDAEEPAVKVVASRSEKYQDFLKRVKRAAGINMSTKVRVWKLLDTLEANTGRAGIPTPESSRTASPALPTAPLADSLKLILDAKALESMGEGTQKELLDIRDETANEKYNGRFTLDAIGFPETQTLVLDERVRDESNIARARASTPQVSNRDGPTKSAGILGLGAKNSGTSSPRKSPPTSGMMTRGRANKRAKSKGTAGLQNLGNTCYMNSALQCIRGIEELTIYFLEETFKEELNGDNPLGHNGAIAKAYASLIHSIYTGNQSFAPRVFKGTLGRCQPLFSSYGQQDSQEFLSFLIDGLHEDLNRIQKKPYIENPESDDKTVHDPQAIRQLGEQFRENHEKRNDSVAMDLFSGFYKNTMVCPDCEKVSVTFDPYAQVTLQLPIEHPWQHKIHFFPLHDRPVVIDVDIDKASTIRGLKEYVARRISKAKPENLVIAEEYQKRFYKVFENAEMLSDAGIGESDKICVYELDDSPTNWPPLDKKKFKKSFNLFGNSNDTPVPEMSSNAAERMAVPVLSRFKQGNPRAGHILSPFFILVTREEAKDSESVFRKVMQKVETMTTRPLFEDEDSPTIEDKVSVNDGKNIDDGTASDDTRVQARSVEGDDELVDVTMTNGVSETKAEDGPSICRRPRSRVLDLSCFVDAGIRASFDMCFQSGHNELIPTNLTSVSDSAKLQLLSSREPQRPSRKLSSSSLASRGSGKWKDEGSQSSDDELADGDGSLNDSAAPVSADESDDNSRNSRTWTGKSKTRRLGPRFMRGKGNIFRRSKSRGEQKEDYLLRLGESLILDWYADGYDQLFGGSNADDMRGQPSDEHQLKLPDPELEARRQKRNARKKAGITLDECFAESSKSEVLSEDNAWYCSRCKELRRATKTLEMWTVPDILVVHLKRFSSGGRLSLRDKIEALVDFPVTGLDLSGKVGLPEDKSLAYDLFAVDNHFGGIGGGHYTANVKNFVDGNWYEYNDALVSQCSPESAVTKYAYLLFYRRRADGPLGPSYLKDLVTKARRSAESPSEPLGGLGEESKPVQAEPADDPMNVSNDEPPQYGEHDLDEGISMDDGRAENPINTIEEPELPSQNLAAPFNSSSWTFARLGDNNGIQAPNSSEKGTSSDVGDADLDSDKPALGSDDGRDRMMEDFGDDIHGAPQLMEQSEGHVEQVGMGPHKPENEDDVAEVRISDDEQGP